MSPELTEDTLLAMSGFHPDFVGNGSPQVRPPFCWRTLRERAFSVLLIAPHLPKSWWAASDSKNPVFIELFEHAPHQWVAMGSSNGR